MKLKIFSDHKHSIFILSNKNKTAFGVTPQKIWDDQLSELLAEAQRTSIETLDLQFLRRYGNVMAIIICVNCPQSSNNSTDLPTQYNRITLNNWSDTTMADLSVSIPDAIAMTGLPAIAR
jgi:hypothetical protein